MAKDPDPTRYPSTGRYSPTEALPPAANLNQGIVMDPLNTSRENALLINNPKTSLTTLQTLIDDGALSEDTRTAAKKAKALIVDGLGINKGEVWDNPPLRDYERNQIKNAAGRNEVEAAINNIKAGRVVIGGGGGDPN